MDFKALMNSSEYDFLRTNERLDNRHIFLSKRAIKSFGGYADSRLRRLDEAAAKTSLPDHPDMERVVKFVERINRYAVTGEPI